MAWSLVVMLQAERKAQRVQQPLSGFPQQAGFLVKGVHWGHLGAKVGHPLQAVKEGGDLLKAMAERPAEVECSQSANMKFNNLQHITSNCHNNMASAECKSRN